MKFKLILIFILSAFVLTLIFSACSDSSGSNEKYDVEQYRQKLRDSGTKNSITPEQRKEGIKSIFPKMKDDN